MQQEIVRDISEKLKLRISPEDQKKLATHKTENWEAYNLYLKGRYYWNKFTDDDMRKSVDYFQQAIAKDPNYALAYAGLADAYPRARIHQSSFGDDAQVKSGIDESFAIGRFRCRRSCGFGMGLVEIRLEFPRSGERVPTCD